MRNRDLTTHMDEVQITVTLLFHDEHYFLGTITSARSKRLLLDYMPSFVNYMNPWNYNQPVDFGLLQRYLDRWTTEDYIDDDVHYWLEQADYDQN